MKRSRKKRGPSGTTPFRLQVRRIEWNARQAGVASVAPDTERLRHLAGELGHIHRQLASTGGHPDLQRHVVALRRLIIEVCDAHPRPQPSPVTPQRHVAEIRVAGWDDERATTRSAHQQFPDESGDSVRTVGGGLPGLGRRR